MNIPQPPPRPELELEIELNEPEKEKDQSLIIEQRQQQLLQQLQQPSSNLLRSQSNATTSTTATNYSTTNTLVGSSPILTSPSLLSIGRSTSLGSTKRELHQITVDNNTTVLTTRTSSLTKDVVPTAAAASGNSRFSDGLSSSSTSTPSNHYLTSPKLYSTPSSPLARMVQTSTDPKSIHALMDMDENDPSSMNFPNYALLSELSTCFVDQVKRITKRRKIFTTTEYPTSFNGEEAVDIMRSILPSGLPSSLYLKVARSLMHTSPPVIAPITYSEKSNRRNTLYESNHEVYLLVDDGIPQGVYTPLTRCYTNYCLPGQGGCYASCCPNKLKSDKLVRTIIKIKNTNIIY